MISAASVATLMGYAGEVEGAMVHLDYDIGMVRQHEEGDGRGKVGEKHQWGRRR